jgi:AraC family transcriptional regulator
MDSIAQALAATLVQLRGNLKRSLPQYHCGLTPTQLSRVKHLVYGRIDQEISLQEMARAAGLSVSYFNQMFRRSTGQAAHQFVLNARVEHAKDLLKSPRLRVMDVAISCGFQTSQHFARVFRSVCAVTPTEYRRTIGNCAACPEDVQRLCKSDMVAEKELHAIDQKGGYNPRLRR